MNLVKPFIGLAVLIVLAVGVASSAYVVPEARQAVITQFGNPVGDPVTSAGVHFKLPFIQDVRFVDKRILTWDGTPNQVPTKEKKYINVDTTARWKIIDALTFIQTVQNERGAHARLSAIIDSATRDMISNNRLVEAVRTNNQILDVIEERRREAMKKRQERQKEGEEADVAPEEVAAEETVGEVERVYVGREELSKMIEKKAATELESFGIALVDVQLRRISYEESVEAKVYERMISERKRIAEKIRSIGQGQRAAIQGKTDRDLKRIESEAYRKAQKIKGDAEARAIEIYARAIKKSPSFYEFTRTLDAYKKSLGDKTEFILSTDSEFLDRLRRD